jgi:hypothetical protein
MVLLTVLLSSCISGSGFYQAHYPNKLKQGKTKKVKHTTVQNENTAPVLDQQLEKQSISENKNQIEDKFNTELAAFQIADSSIAYDATLNVDVVLENTSIREIIKPVYSNRNQNKNNKSNTNCPKVTDLTCSYIAKNTYKLSWTQPKGQMYSDNGRLSEYRIIRESLSDSKIYVFKTPEPTCEGTGCSIVLHSQTDPAGYKWTIETRCDLTTFERGNSIDCKPDVSMDEDPIFAENQNGKRLNKKSLLSVLMIPMLMIAGILVVILLFQDLPFLAGLLLVGIAVGCIVAIVKAVQGGREVKNSKGKQWGTGLSVLAILGSLLGLFLTGFLMYVVFTY